MRLQPGSVPLQGPDPGAEWWQALAGGGLDSVGCAAAGSDCVAIVRDLDGDGVRDVLLCNLGGEHMTHCRLHADDRGQWYDVVPVALYGNRTNEVANALRRGELKLVPRRWPDLEVAGGRTSIDIPDGPPVSTD